MGNCLQKKQYHDHHLQAMMIKKKTIHVAEITPSDQITPNSKPTASPHAPETTLCGDPTNPSTYYLRFILRYKPLSLRYFPSRMPLYLFTLRYQDDDAVSGPPRTVLEYIESKLPDPPLLMARNERDYDEMKPLVVRLAELQHKSMRWHLERVVRWGMDLVTRGGRRAVDPSVGTPKMEMGKFGKSYGKVLELLLEHAQMEERVVFPILNAADRGVCRCVNGEHARDLPILNGIKEDIKSIGVLEAGTPNHREALRSLSARLNTLQDNCKEHFEEEERSLFPLMEAADLTKGQQIKVVEQCVDVMKATHSHLFHFFVEGLLPHEVMEYMELIMICMDKERATSVLRVLVDD